MPADTYPQILATIAKEKFWAMEPNALKLHIESARSIDASKLGGPGKRRRAYQQTGGQSREAYDVKNGVAVIPIEGILTPYATDWDDVMGYVSGEQICEVVNAAAADATVSGILLNIDSPGGFVSGTEPAAAAIAAAGNVKPVHAFVPNMCCSGAYWLASQAAKITCAPTSEVGNIGVYSVLVDLTGFYTQLGVSVTLVASGKYKGMGADGKVTEPYAEDTQRIIMELYQLFTSAVSTGRGMSMDKLAPIADGKSYVGASAVSVGLADEVGDMAAAFSDLVAYATPKGKASASAGSARPAVSAGREWDADKTLQLCWKDRSRYVAWRTGQLAPGAGRARSDAGPVRRAATRPPAITIEGAEAKARAEWSANTGNLRQRWISQDTYVRARRRELTGA